MAGYKKNIHPIVTDEENKFGHEVLLKRIANGEDPYDIMKLDRAKCKYYVEKLVAGLCPLTHLLYYRITHIRPKYMLVNEDSTVRTYEKYHEKMDETVKELCLKSFDKNAAEITRNCEKR